MPLTDEQYQKKIASDLGQADDPNFAEVVSLNWEMRDDVAYLGGYLRFLYVKRETLLSLLGGAWRKYRWSDADVSEDEGQVFKNLQALLERTDGDIQAARNQARGGQVMGGIIAAQTPIDPDLGRPDPSDRAYRGDPLRPLPRRPGQTRYR